MSENTTEPTATDGDETVEVKSLAQVEAEASQVEAEETETKQEAPAPRSQRGTGRLTAMVAWLAFIIAAAAAVLMAYERLQPEIPDAAAERSEAALEALSASLDSTQGSVDDLNRQLSTLSDADSANRRAVEAIEGRFSNQLQQVESLPGRIGNLERSVASIQGISTGVRDTWLLAEAEYYMQIANAQLQLASNPHLATLALRLADERIEQLANPALIEVRRALADELQSLEVINKPDIEGITLTLASLASVVESLPLREQLPMVEQSTANSDEELSGWQRALASLKRTMGGIVSIRRTDETMRPLLAPEAQYFLRANLALQLQAARLALLLGEQSVYQQSLDDATSWLGMYYDTASAPVAGAQQTIAEIRDSTFDMAVPDISGSLHLLRQHNVLSGEQGNGPAQ